MDKPYLEYTAEELVDDQQFLLWLNHLSDNHELDELVSGNPPFALEVSKAREMITLLKVKEEPVLQDHLFSMWKNIHLFEKTNRGRMKCKRHLSFLKYAAAIVVVLSLTILGYWKLKQTPGQEWYTFKTVHSIQQSRLILSTGEEIDLKRDASSIKVNGLDHAIKINNDSTIALSNVSKKAEESALNQVVVPYGKKSFIELADGTKVCLNAGSKLAFPDRFSGSKREVFLEGEAYFDVTPEKGFPFFVRTKELIIKVLGTKFNLSAYEADKEVMTVLVEGKVSLRENIGIDLFGEEIILNRNESALFNKSDFSTKVSHVEQTEIFTAWTEGWFPFSKEPLENVFKKIERYYNVRFVYNSLFPSGDLISGKLDLKDSIDEVMKVLSDVTTIKYRIDKGIIYIELNNTMPMRK